MVDHKISEFPVATTLADADLLTLLHGGVNQIITWANAKATVFTALFTNASDFPIDADATSAGDRSVTFTLTATTFVRLLWNSSLSIFQLVNNSGTLQKLAIANGTSSTHAVTKAQLDTEVSARVAADAALVAAQVFTDSFISADQTITQSGSLTIAHGLGAEPIEITTYLKCTTAEYGYSVGDTVPVNNSLQSYATGGVLINRNQQITFDATDIFVRFANTGGSYGVYILLNKSTGSTEDLTDANWKLIIKAYA